jgi:hypothetical protein
VHASKKVQIVDRFYERNQIAFQEIEALRIIIQWCSVRNLFWWLREAGGMQDALRERAIVAVFSFVSGSNDTPAQ